MGTTSRTRKAVRAAASLASLLAGLTAVIGFAHTRPGRPLLAWLGRTTGLGAKAAGCPLGYDQSATPEQKQAARSRFAATHGGTATALNRPALGFQLDRTTRADVTAWAAARGVACEAGKGQADLSCARVSDTLVPEAFRGVGAETVWFSFGADERLVSVIAVAQSDDAAAIQAAFNAITNTLDREAGAPARVEGSPDALPSGLLYQASAEYRFRDYYAVTRATNVGKGFALTEEYRSLTAS
jgi:hypothetical protein